MTNETVTNVPKNRVCQVVLGFIDDGAIKIVLKKNESGKWDITATFPDDE